MGAMPSRAQSEFYKGLLPIELADEAPTVFTADLKNDRFATGQPLASEETSRPLARFLIPFCIGVTATLTWQSYSAAAKQIIAPGLTQSLRRRWPAASTVRQARANARHTGGERRLGETHRRPCKRQTV